MGGSEAFSKVAPIFTNGASDTMLDSIPKLHTEQIHIAEKNTEQCDW